MHCPPWKQVLWLYVRAGSIQDNLCRIVPGTLSLRCWVQHKLEVLLGFVESDYGTALRSPNITYTAAPHRRMQRSLPALGRQRHCPLQISALSLYGSIVVPCKNFFCMWHIYNLNFWKRKASREKSKPSPQLLGNIKTSKTCSQDLNHIEGINFDHQTGRGAFSCSIKERFFLFLSEADFSSRFSSVPCLLSPKLKSPSMLRKSIHKMEQLIGKMPLGEFSASTVVSSAFTRVPLWVLH